jgi:hypothetical protein
MNILCIILNVKTDTNTKVLYVVIKREKILTVHLKLILLQCLNGRFVTAHNECSKLSPSASMHFANCVQRSRVFRQS